jgi:hypothetical protein
MRFWPWRRRERFDPEALAADLARAWGSKRPPEEVAADFKQLFLGSEQGKRVLYEIFAWGHLWRSSMAATTEATAFNEGERNIGLKIMAALRKDPKPLPVRQRQKRPKE